LRVYVESSWRSSKNTQWRAVQSHGKTIICPIPAGHQQGSREGTVGPEPSHKQSLATAARPAAANASASAAWAASALPPPPPQSPQQRTTCSGPTAGHSVLAGNGCVETADRRAEGAAVGEGTASWMAQTLARAKVSHVAAASVGATAAASRNSTGRGQGGTH